MLTQHYRYSVCNVGFELTVSGPNGPLVLNFQHNPTTLVSEE